MVHLPLLTLAFPANTKLAFDIMIDLANLKIIPVDLILEQVLSIKKRATQESGGYSGNIFESMGLILMTAILAVIVVLSLLLIKFALKRIQKVKNLA